ncbi:hypothetical protein [Pseudomonas sp. zfem003]|uniref:hypothetical protein n=1 Tax=Pseudomonas sp. zfem003 TaxID=3078198 RepID=UPI0029299911|nr:hypothetical protein [Pseudomonas sp. zfem003]MDU9398077.1 hypothetical protein [Pseudomonas sp. zfem003]
MTHELESCRSVWPMPPPDIQRTAKRLASKTKAQAQVAACGAEEKQMTFPTIEAAIKWLALMGIHTQGDMAAAGVRLKEVGK